MRFSELDGARIGVWGAGREIRSFAAQLGRRLPSAQLAVAAFDAAPGEDVRPLLGAPAARVVVGSEAAAAALAECDVVVRSPGVSVRRPELGALRERGVAVVTATGLWLAERGGRGVIGVTGTKGKSTTAALLAHVARAAGVPISLAGNIGVPALDLLDEPAERPAVVELSSFQIADLAVGPQIALLVSLFHEHVDWHGSEEAYRADKLRLLGLPGVRAAVLDGREEPLAEAVGAGVAVTRFASAGGWDATDEGILRGGSLVVPAASLPLRGSHNAVNLCAALAGLEAFGIAAPPLPDALRGFRELPHRLEVVLERDGVAWVDDSISTTPQSALAALASFEEREIVLIGGGQDRGQDYGELARALAARGAAVLGLPVTGGRLVAAARAAGVAAERAVEVADMEAAVAWAAATALPGTAVLLSPAAPSFGAYRDFEQRGEHFRALVEDALVPQWRR